MSQTHRFRRLVTNGGREVVARDASLRWCDDGGENNYQGDFWMEQIDRTHAFRLTFQGREVVWLATPGRRVKTKGEPVDGILHLTSNGLQWTMQTAKKKSLQHQ
jgi:hypothetical protein